MGVGTVPSCSNVALLCSTLTLSMLRMSRRRCVMSASVASASAVTAFDLCNNGKRVMGKFQSQVERGQGVKAGETGQRLARQETRNRMAGECSLGAIGQLSQNITRETVSLLP